MQKFSCVAKISTKVTGVTFYAHPVELHDRHMKVTQEASRMSVLHCYFAI